MNQNKKSSFMTASPMVKGLGKFCADVSEENRASYNGVFKKTGFFILLTFVGYILYNLIDRFYLSKVFSSLVDDPAGAEDIVLNFTVVSLVFLLVSLVVCIVCPIVAMNSPRLAPIFGGIYSVTQGIFISCSVRIACSSGRLQEIGAETIALFALAATGLIVFFMGLMYQKGIIRATGKFKTVLFSALGAFLIISIITLILSLIPGTREIVAIFASNPVISIGFSILGLLLAAFFLISDFDMIQQTVECGLEKKYEWTAAFGLVITLIWIYVKILEIVYKIFGDRN